jgi:protein TonB
VNVKGVLISVSLACVLGGAVVAPHRTTAQDSAPAEEGKRAIRVRVNPTYPALAMQMGLHGKVKVACTVAADGHVDSTHLIGGSPMFVDAALEAAKKWRFEAGPRETTETVEFLFSPSGS